MISEDLTELPISVRPGLCQVFEDFDLYNLKDFDNIQAGRSRDTPSGTPVTAPIDGSSTGDKFMYRMCSGSWSMSLDYFKTANPSAKVVPRSCD